MALGSMMMDAEGDGRAAGRVNRGESRGPSLHAGGGSRGGGGRCEGLSEVRGLRIRGCHGESLESGRARSREATGRWEEDERSDGGCWTCTQEDIPSVDEIESCGRMVVVVVGDGGDGVVVGLELSAAQEEVDERAGAGQPPQKGCPECLQQQAG